MSQMRGEGLAGFLERHGDEGAEVAWQASLAWLERAASTAREVRFGRFRNYPAGELRKLRQDVSRSLELARFAVALQEDENERVRELDVELREVAAETGRARRRAGTREAERVRVLNAKAKREGRELTDEERFPHVHENGRRRPSGAT